MEPSFYRDMRRCEDWDWWHAGRRRILRRVLAAGLRQAGLPDSGLAVLDVGCGTGGTTVFLGTGHRMMGCDVAREALDEARGRRVTLARATADRLPFRDGAFDVVLALDVLEHHEDDGAVAREAARVVRPGGLVLATVPCFDFLFGPHDVVSRHHRRYVLASFVDVLRRAGLRLLRASYFNTLLFPLVATVQVARRLLRGGRPPEARSDMATPDTLPGPANAVLREIFAAEGPWLSRWPLPVGVSALALARRVPEGAAS